MVIFDVERSKGNYQGADYDNIVFECFSDYTSKNHLAGTPSEFVKVKSDIVIDCLGKSLSSINWDDVIGMELLPQYNKFGQVVSFSLSADSSVTSPTSSDTLSSSKSSSKK